MSNGSKQTNGEKRVDAHFTCRLLHGYENNFKLGSIAAAQSLTVDPSFLDHIWSLEAMTIDKQVLIPIYEMSAKEIEGYIKCFDVNVQTWVIIVRADQVQGALKS